MTDAKIFRIVFCLIIIGIYFLYKALKSNNSNNTNRNSNDTYEKIKQKQQVLENAQKGLAIRKEQRRIESLKIEEQRRIENLKIVEASTITDDFTKDISIKITKVAGIEDTSTISLCSMNESGSVIIFLTVFYFRDKIYLSLKSISKIFKMKKDNTMYFLFDDETVLTFSFLNNSTLLDGTYSNVIGISIADLKIFYTKRLMKIKVVGEMTDVISFSSFNQYSPYRTLEEGQILFQLMIRKFTDTVLQLAGTQTE